MQLTRSHGLATYLASGTRRVCLRDRQRHECAMGLCRRRRCLSWVPSITNLGLVNNLLLCLAKDIPSCYGGLPAFVATQPYGGNAHSLPRLATLTWGVDFAMALAVEKCESRETLEGVSLDKVLGFWSGGERIH